jgi:hypothetical protein
MEYLSDWVWVLRAAGAQSDQAVPLMETLLAEGRYFQLGVLADAFRPGDAKTEEVLRRAIAQASRKGGYDDALRLAKRIAHGNVEVAKVLGDGLRTAAPGLRLEALTLLASFGTNAVPALRAVAQCLQDPATDIRYAAARTLEAMGANAAAAVPALEAARTDPDTMVSNAVARAMRPISGDAAR